MFKEPFQNRSTSEQVADYLRERIKRGRLSGLMPGVHSLGREFGVHHTTVAEALRQLEAEGYLKGEGAGKRRKIMLPSTDKGLRLKVGVLLYEPDDNGTQLINELRHDFSRTNHDLVVASKTLVEMQFDVSRIGKLVEGTKADAWLVLAGSKQVLEWFAQQQIPTFAMYGHAASLDMTHISTVKDPGFNEIMQSLFGYGHKRIVMLMGEQYRGASLSPRVQLFRDALESRGLNPSSYNLPDWNYEKGSLQRCLRALFQVTPPTALIVDDPMIMPVIFQFANHRKIVIPDDISLVCLERHSWFKWMDPAISHLASNEDGAARHVVRWVNRLAKGQNQHRRIPINVKFIKGGTIGPAPH